MLPLAECRARDPGVRGARPAGRRFLTNPVANRASRVQGRALGDRRRGSGHPALSAVAARVAGPGHSAPVMGAVRRAESAPHGPRRYICLRQGPGRAGGRVRLGIAGSYESQRIQHDSSSHAASPIAPARRRAPLAQTAPVSTCCRRRTTACITSLPVLKEHAVPRPRFHHHPFDQDDPSPRGCRAFSNRGRRGGVTTGGGPSPSGSADRLAAARPLSCSRFAGRSATPHEAMAAVTNDIFTKEDGEFLVRNKALAAERSPRSKPAAVRMPRSARTSARIWKRCTSKWTPAQASPPRNRRGQPRRPVQPRTRRLHHLGDRRLRGTRSPAKAAQESRRRPCRSTRPTPPPWSAQTSMSWRVTPARCAAPARSFSRR